MKTKINNTVKILLYTIASMMLAPLQVEATQCVEYARERSGIPIYGDAWTWWDSAIRGSYHVSNTPRVGSVLVWPRQTGMATYGHVAYVSQIVSSGVIKIDHANWSPLGAVDGKIYTGIYVKDESGGNWTSVKVQYGNVVNGTIKYGSTKWRVNGFISRTPPNTAPVIANLSASADYLGNVVVTFNVNDTTGDRVSQTDVWVRSGSSTVSGTYVNGTTYTLGAHRVVIPAANLRGRLFTGSYYTVGVRSYDSAWLGSGDRFSNSFPYNQPAVTTAPEINLSISGTQIACNSSQNSAANFTSTTVGSEQYNRYTIENTGTGTLTVGALNLSNTTDFSIYSNPASSVAPGQTTTFGIKFRPTSAGTKSCTVSLVNNDSNENPYAFAISGTAQGGTTTTSAMDRFASANQNWLGTFTGSTSQDSTFTYRHYSSGNWLANQTGTNIVWYQWNGTWYNAGAQ